LESLKRFLNISGEKLHNRSEKREKKFEQKVKVKKLLF